MITIHNVDLTTEPGEPVLHLSTTPSAKWREAFNAYVAHGKALANHQPSEPPPGIPQEIGVVTGAGLSNVQAVGDTIRVKLGPSVAWAQLEPFVDNAMDYANEQVPGG